MVDNQSTNPDESVGRTKVSRLIREYDLDDGMGIRLEKLWTGNGDERMSLRSLADLFNKKLLETTMTNANMSTVDGEAENLYRLLTSDDVSRGKYTEARNLLEREEVDVDRLEKDFVTYQAIRSYLQNERDAEYQERDAEDKLTSSIESIQRLESRIRSVSDNTLTQLRNSSIITLGEFRIFININVHCEDCETQSQVTELLRNGGCECND